MTDEIKIKFEPGCFDDFEGTQEELDEFVAAIIKLIQSEEFQAQLEDVEEGDFVYEDYEAREILNSFKNASKKTLH